MDYGKGDTVMINTDERIKRCLMPWCHKIIPLIYDDSLSYYEVLCKLTHKINEVISLFNDELQPIDFEKLINDIMEGWLKNGTIYSILSGQLPKQVLVIPEYISTYTFKHGSWDNSTTWECIQSMCFLSGSTAVGVRSPIAGSDTNTCKIFKFNRNTGIRMESDVNVTAGHSNDICTDGEYIYIAWCYDKDDNSSNKITVCDTNLNTVKTITLDVSRIYGMDYNPELKNFFVQNTQNSVLVYDKTLTNVIDTIEFNVDYYRNWYGSPTGRFTTQTVTCIPEGFMISYSYPSISIQFDFDGTIRHIYNYSDYYANGFNTFELEKIAYNWTNGWCYIMSYAVQGLGDLSNNTYGRFNLNKGQCTDIVVIASTRPNYYNSSGHIHVDGTIDSNAKMLGTAGKPFKYMQQAVDCKRMQEQALTIAIDNVRTTPNLGTVAISNQNNIVMTAFTTSGTNDNFDNPIMFIPQMVITDCNNICIFNQNVDELTITRSSGCQIGHTGIGTSATLNRAIGTSLIGANQIPLLNLQYSQVIGRTLASNNITLGSVNQSFDAGSAITT